MIHVGHAGTFGLFTHDFGCGTLGTDEQNLLFLVRHIGHFIQRGIQCWNRVLKIDDMDFVAGAEDVWLHFWIPVATLVPEMHSCTEHFFHAYSHVVTYVLG